MGGIRNEKQNKFIDINDEKLFTANGIIAVDVAIMHGCVGGYICQCYSRKQQSDEG
ncbi:hypothetical protein HMPREF0653_01661 [Prevotella disiens JCM 6334 = ATCC 29426]|uniref:Uncharacterized protein n=1 Tax=Prevotella disiens JCM 6334 = ATCC 29426 TaxID=1235811 RepID=A0ABN0NRN7_9BACT|nr:hypothetical protein HMPREF0653_01661 [Prevotella disiens JCM 6334 = ATCC 29426]